MMRALMTALAFALPATAQDVPEGTAVTYDCEGGRVMQVAYINVPGGPSYAVVAWDGELIPMKSGPTGSGVRYVSLDQPEALVWHTKGDEGFLARDADMSMLAKGCISRAGP
jgi:membrane-bound inhibitor of C-type lysozyme